VTKGIILDRDGTLVDVVRDEETGVIATAFHPSQLRLLPGVLGGLAMLRDAGFVLAMATNQPGPAKGQFSRDAVNATNDALVAMLAREKVQIAHVAVCMHHPDGGRDGDATLIGPCECRKPKPGMLVEIEGALGLERALSWMIGDTASDIEAGRALGMHTGLLFDQRRCELCPLRAGTRVIPDVEGPTLIEVARAITRAG
jgi:D-glycero-D-manno-heptose 1,7-bisphosphate phosphatase